MTKRLAVLVSRTGSLLEAMLERSLPIALVGADRPCRALQIAQDAGVPSVRLLPRSFDETFDRAEYTHEMLALLRAERIELVALAGFMTIFSPSMFAPDAFMLKILNIHPSLLPSFKGGYAVRDAIAYGVKVSGCTIHWVTEELDAGPILLQHPVPVITGDTTESLHQRIREAERTLYAELLHEFLVE